MLGWDGDGAGPVCAIPHLCMSSTSLILFRFHLTEAISEQLWVCGVFSGILYNFPVGKNQYWRSRAKPASGFLQKNKMKWGGGVCRAESGASRGYFSLLWVNAGARSSLEHSLLFLLNPIGNLSLENGGGEAGGMQGIWDCSSPGNAAMGSPQRSPEPPFSPPEM